jgi:hypothetical protein
MAAAAGSRPGYGLTPAVFSIGCRNAEIVFVVPDALFLGRMTLQTERVLFIGRDQKGLLRRGTVGCVTGDTDHFSPGAEPHFFPARPFDGYRRLDCPQVDAVGEAVSRRVLVETGRLSVTGFTENGVYPRLVNRQDESPVGKASVGHVAAFADYLVGLAAGVTAVPVYVPGNAEGGFIKGVVSFPLLAAFINVTHLAHFRIFVRCPQKNGSLDPGLG